jgi:hypothetical protein
VLSVDDIMVLVDNTLRTLFYQLITPVLSVENTMISTIAIFSADVTMLSAENTVLSVDNTMLAVDNTMR